MYREGPVENRGRILYPVDQHERVALDPSEARVAAGHSVLAGDPPRVLPHEELAELRSRPHFSPLGQGSAERTAPDRGEPSFGGVVQTGTVDVPTLAPIGCDRTLYLSVRGSD